MYQIGIFLKDIIISQIIPAASIYFLGLTGIFASSSIFVRLQHLKPAGQGSLSPCVWWLSMVHHIGQYSLFFRTGRGATTVLGDSRKENCTEVFG
jgi:hypothetical protein